MQNRIFFDKETIEQAKTVSIPVFLQSIGIEPLKTVGNEWLYLSPLRNEKTASFYVNTSKNCFTDFGGSEQMKGDSIRLVQIVNNCHFKEAVKVLLGLAPQTISFSFSGHSTSTKNGLTVAAVKPLTHTALIKYVQSRGIALNLAKAYLNEVHYLSNDKPYFAVGFRNDNDGFELRNSLGFKGKTANGVSTFDLGTDSIAVFEGFFDFLSALQHYDKQAPSISTIVLNTTNNLKAVLPILAQYRQINTFLDNDKAGLQALKTLINSCLNVKNYASLLYPNHKDFNAYLCENSNVNRLKTA
ncbi:toprim domain-containing protein [Runella rosea]|nr:toprim domain-containing protein [Runella rosea]